MNEEHGGCGRRVYNPVGHGIPRARLVGPRGCAARTREPVARDRSRSVDMDYGLARDGVGGQGARRAPAPGASDRGTGPDAGRPPPSRQCGPSSRVSGVFWGKRWFGGGLVCAV